MAHGTSQTDPHPLARDPSSVPPVPPCSALTFGEIARVLLIAGFIAGAMWLVNASPWGQRLAFRNVDRFQAWLRQWGYASGFVFLLLGTALVSIGFPRIVLAMAAGAMFSLVPAIILSQMATTFAAIPGYYYARWMGREMLLRRMGPRLHKLDGATREHGFMVLLLIRLCPIGNALLTNCLAGVSSVGFLDFIGASFLGFLPETIIFVLLGGGFAAHLGLKLWCSIALFVAFSLSFLYLFKRSPLAGKIMTILREES